MTFNSMIQVLFYRILYFFALLILLPFEYFKRPKELRRRWLREKFGIISATVQKESLTETLPGKKTPLLWIHAVSVGEVSSSIPLLRKIREKYPYVGLLLTTITDTGQRVAIERVPPGTRVAYLPFDLKETLKRSLKNIRPDVFITMETEIWPNLFVTFKQRKIPVIIMNGRISEKSFKRYRKIRFFMKHVLASVDLFAMQETVYAERIKALGAPENKTAVIGNFKFDTRPSENIPLWTHLLAQPMIIAGSTHAQEEELVLSSYQILKQDFPDLNLIIAPRHPERFQEVEELIKAKGLHCSRSSKLCSEPADPQSIRSRIVLLDAVGELASVYKACDIAVIGGSFIPHGGQNLLEPAYWSKPILCGPHMENFPFVKEFYDAEAAFEVTEDTLYEKLKLLLHSPEKRKLAGGKARKLYDQKTGAVERAADMLKQWLIF